MTNSVKDAPNYLWGMEAKVDSRVPDNEIWITKGRVLDRIIEWETGNEYSPDSLIVVEDKDVD